MNRRFTAPALAAALLLGTGVPLSAQANAGHDHGHAHAPAAAAQADGVVRKVDRQAGRVTIAHGPLPNGMPAMTMVFRPQEAAWLEQLREGDKIRFRAEDRQGVMTLTQFEIVK